MLDLETSYEMLGSYTFPVLVPEQVNDAQHYTPRLAPFVLTGSSWQLPLSYQSHSNLGQT